jgi:hypothetical protein
LALTTKKRAGRINRLEGAGLVAAYLGYTGYLAWTIISVV